MGGEKKEPLHKSFGYAWEGITAVIKKERNMKIHCCVMILVIFGGGNLSDCRMEVVYLLLFVRSGYVAGNRKYCSGSRCDL